ncbi:septal ring lytic transglycosylase RlpA family protein [Flavobacterium sp. J49]|uniref:septal ring lytic transglycosylase RlpA family protein n=1 Tax=Flavobacterium sp. J49 TaxID=2718534 RepID=UPI0015931C87|nr:septal ring lytic transglycosylase RlpA family protein [Flavobacterium sp. J49]MBF6641302.1 septal ring lytic transglycosylase RlpA family protein [Flavobacterium sp. J49]NIC02549.1 septal ring lytic transglycosylase RlpA family protein [Flavobacterium sp. J49]
MNTKIAILLFSIITSVFAFNVSVKNPQQKEKPQEKPKEKGTTVKDDKDKIKVVADTLKSRSAVDFQETDTLQIDPNSKLKIYKKNAHASYYHNKFNGRRTASGKRFDNNKYTAAHKKLPFGTIVKVTNEANGKSVVVEITDRGPFSKVREIDLSRRAFMDIASNKNSGSVIVKIEVVEERK